jgi:hypothetical protein
MIPFTPVQIPHPSVTASGTDFRTWKRENVEALAVTLTAEVLRLRALLEERK